MSRRQVRTHIPVVFFTAKGVPGEVDEGMDSVKGAIAACSRAMRNAAAAAGAAAHPHAFRWRAFAAQRRGRWYCGLRQLATAPRARAVQAFSQLNRCVSNQISILG